MHLLKTSFPIVGLLAMLTVNTAVAQFAPQAPLPGNDAIVANDSRIIGWATGCTVQRGWLDISDKPLGLATLGQESYGAGAFDQNIVSLGDSGVAVLTFEHSIKNGNGPDFVIFENGFPNPQDATKAYLELAFVEVSSDGVEYVRFPAVCHVSDTAQNTNFTYTDASLLHNLAGKYIAGYGTPFDLEELPDNSNIDINSITHIRLIDVIGTLDSNLASFDSEGNVINNSYPSPFASCGFDLDAVGVINSNKPVSVIAPPLAMTSVFPNPFTDILHISAAPEEKVSYRIINITGQMVMQGVLKKDNLIATRQLIPGLYYLELQTESDTACRSLIKQ